MEFQTDYTVQIDIFSPGNLTNLAKQAKNRMIDAGFMRSYKNENMSKKLNYLERYFV